MRFNFIQLLELALFGAGIMVIAIGAHLQGRHIDRVPRIATPEDFAAFKRFARGQMYLTIALLAFVVPAIVLIFFEGTPGTFMENVLLWSPCAVIGLSSYYTKSQERKIRDPGRVAPEFASEFDDICYVWSKKLLPNF